MVTGSTVDDEGNDKGGYNDGGGKKSQKTYDDDDDDDGIKQIRLVLPKDRKLIPAALFVALGQMKPCRLTQSDRVGCYKTRDIGFLGMCCKHCGGQPGFGRYFPNSVRSLAQTTTSQTILKHIGGKCRFCPPNVRKAVLELQRQQAHKEHLSTGRPRYGSRKIFFQRMWSRLHGTSPEDGNSSDGGFATVVADGNPDIVTSKAGNMPLAENTTKEAGSNKPALTTEATTAVRTVPPSEVSTNSTDDEGVAAAAATAAGAATAASTNIGNDEDDSSSS